MMIEDKKDKERVNFSISAAPGSLVSVAGTFNNWDPAANPMRDLAGKGSYKTDVLLSQGKHEYKFVVNGIWTADPSCQRRVSDSYGAENCLLQVSKSESKVS